MFGHSQNVTARQREFDEASRMNNGDKFIGQQELVSKLDQPALLLNNEQVSFANDAAKQLLGQHITGANVRLALRAPSAISTALSKQPARALVPRIGTPDSLWELNCQPLDGTVRLITLNNVSAQQSISRVHADFVANASHELRTPVANILGYAETLLGSDAVPKDEMQTRFLGTIQREAQRMQTIISDLMSLSRIEAVKHRLPDERCDLAKLVRETADEFADSAEIKLVLGSAPMELQGDAAQLKQMLRNLIDNAVKYGEPGSVSITLDITRSDWASLTVSNKGEPIPAEHIPRLTERFYRIDAGRSKEAGGTGLGLSIVKHIVIRHRGRLDIASDAEEGTRIDIRLPTA